MECFQFLLKSNRLKEATLDAFDPEPLPPNHPFLSLDPELQKRLVLTPRMFQEPINNVLRVMNGEGHKYVVNLNQT